MLLQYIDGHEMEVVIFLLVFWSVRRWNDALFPTDVLFTCLKKNERKTFEYFTRSYLALVTYRL